MTQTITSPLYGTRAALTITNLHSLASSSTLLTGWNSTAVDNSSNLSLEEIITGTIFTGTSPTVSTLIELWAYGDMENTPTYPDTITGSEAAAITLTSANVKLSGGLARLGAITVDATSNRGYPFCYGIARHGFGFVPKKWGLFITHNTGVALKSTGSIISRLPWQLQTN